MKTMDQSDDYKQLEIGLEQAQTKLKEVISSLNSCPFLELTEKGRISRTNHEQNPPFDFESFFAQNGLLDAREKDFPASFQGCADVTNRPDRPLTLSRPGQLPSCCNFKGQHWRLYVQGEFSYNSLPRHFKNADKELNSSYKDDLENIIEDLRRKEEIVEYDRMFQCPNLLGSKIRNRGRSTSNGENFSPTAPEAKSTATHRQQAFIPYKSSKCASDDVTSPEPSSLSHKGSISQNEDLTSQEESTVSTQNECLIEDINRNCTDIRNQLAVLESVTEMIDRAKVNFSVKTRRTKSDESAPTPAAGLRKLPQKDNFVVVNKSFGEKTEACSETFHKADEAQPTVVLKTPPHSPSSRESFLKLSVTSSGSSSYSSPSKKLKSRKSRNRSLQRCSENRLSVSERRSRTLSPSITERLDHRISRATQTCHNSVTFDCLPQTTNAERPTSKMESHDIISNQGQRPVVTVEQNGHQGNVQQNDNLVKNGKLGKQCQEGMKVSPFLSPDRKSAIKNPLSFSFRARPHEKKQSLLKQDSACSAEATQPSVVPCADVSRADQHCQHSESLLDKMHKKLYPYQYNKQSRKRPTEEALGLGTKKNVGPPSSMPISSALPRTKPSLSLQKPRHCVNENSERSSPMVLQAIPNSDEIPVAIIRLSTYEDTLSGDVASPSSGYGDLSPSSLKENASSCCYSTTLSPEQSITSSSTPSPANCLHSSLKTVKEESSACTRKNSKDIRQLHAAEKMLVDTCEWLICAGFPQYVQLYREGHFPVELSSVESDHEFLEPNCLLILIQRITLLNRMTSMKIRLPLTSVTRNWFTGEMLFALSPNWNYDSNCHWWNRSDRNFAANWSTKSCSLLTNPQMSLEHSRNIKILEGSLEFDGLTPVLTEVQDEASIHLTSGYESETSPMSTSSSGHKKPLPRQSSCSSSQHILQCGNSADEAVSDCDRTKQITSSGNQERDWSEFLGSSQETVKRVSCGSRSSSVSNQTIIVQEVHEFKNIPNDFEINITRVDCNDRTGIETNIVAQPAVSHRKVSLYCTENSSKLGKSLANDSCSLFDAGNTFEAVKGKNRMSFHDSGDPQAELDQILAELYRNIGSLDETLNNIDDVDVDGAYHDSQQLLTDIAVSSISKDKHKLSYDMKPGNADVNEIGISEISSYNNDLNISENDEGSKPCAFYQSKKAFLSIRDLVLLQKLCILKLTSVFEMHTASSKPEIICPLRFRSPKKSRCAPEMAAARRRIFGVPPVVLLQKLGVPLPPSVTLAMQHLRAAARNSTGLFRKPGVQSRIQQLQNELENNIGFSNFASVDVYDLADVLKRYFRELPETLLTPQASQLLSAIFTDLPSELHLEAVQAVMLLLSDVSRQVLHILLEFLSSVAHHSEVNQMNASNLAVCFLPSFFRPQELSSSACHVIDTESSTQVTESPVRSTSPIWDHKVAVMCLSFLISNASSAFQIPDFSWTMLQASRSVSKSLSGVGIVTDFQSVNLPSLIQSAVDVFNFKDFEWISYISKYEQTKLSWRAVDDDRLLPLWCCTTAIEAPPGEVLLRLKGEQHLWDANLVKGRIVERLSEETDVFHYVLHLGNQEAPREFCELRSWKHDRDRGSYVLAKMSIFHPNVPLTGILRANTIVSHYLIEPCGAGKSRVVHVSRVDIRGHLFDWYYNVYGRLVERHLYKLNRAFTPVTESTAGPETNL